MKNILNKEDAHSLIDKIRLLSTDDKPLWGKMNVQGMVCHVADAIKMSTGEKQCKFQGNFLLTTVVKQIILLGLPMPKGKAETSDELKQGVKGTPPADFEADKNILINCILNFEKDFREEYSIHPAFGKMSLSQWGRLVYLHANHHLEQFGK